MGQTTLKPKFMSDRADRIIGVDIAKIVAMILVVAVHVNGYGLPYEGNNPPGLGYLLLRSFLDAIFDACINIFAIASGYVGIVSSFKLSRIIRLWIQVVFTGLMVLVCIDLFTGIDVHNIDYLKACFPIAKRQYWYMTAYFMLCFVMPLINVGIKALSRNELRNMVLLLLGVICGEWFICYISALGTEGGYSFEWLLVLYVVGAYLRLYNPLDKYKWSLMSCACGCAMTDGWMPFVLQAVHFKRGFGFSGYTSPFIVLISLCIFALCLKVRVASERLRKAIVLLSSTTLGVYLIHVQPVVFRSVFPQLVNKTSVSGGGAYLCLIIVTTIAIYIVCTLLDFLRIILFRLIGRMASTVPWSLLSRKLND